jgi:hypothetical protein
MYKYMDANTFMHYETIQAFSREGSGYRCLREGEDLLIFPDIDRHIDKYRIFNRVS